LEVRRAQAEDVLSGIAPVSHYFGQVPTPATTTRVTSVLRPERMHLAEEDGAVVGAASAYDLRLTIPGAVVPAAGVTVVGVLPTHRRRGALRALMRAQLDDVRERGEPIAALWASEGTIYGRYGYGLASMCGDIDLELVHGGFREKTEHGGSFRILGADEALETLSPVYARVAGETPGMFERTRDWWEARILADPEDRREGAGEIVRVVLEREGEAEAYALYRLKMEWADGSSTGQVHVLEAMGVSATATAAIWRYLLDIDWMERLLAWQLPLDHPLFLLLAQPRRMRFRVGDSLWIRLADVGAALAARSLEGDVVLEVADAFCPWNDGRYALDGSKTKADPDLRLDVADLASVFLGGFTFPQLLRAGRLEEATEGAVSRADAAFRTDQAPWCPEIF
jgi:predicted acetyltransferase